MLVILDELGEEAQSAVDHTSCLGLLDLAAGQGQGVVHVALLVQYTLGTQNTRIYLCITQSLQQVLQC